VESLIIVTVVMLCIFSCIFTECKIVSRLADLFVTIENSIVRENAAAEEAHNPKNSFNVKRLLVNREIKYKSKYNDVTWSVYAELSENIRLIDQIARGFSSE